MLRPLAVTPVTSAPKCTMTLATLSHRSSSMPRSSARASMESVEPSSSFTSRSRLLLLGLPAYTGPLLADKPIQMANFRARSGRSCDKLMCQSATQTPSPSSSFRRLRPVGQCSKDRMSMSPDHFACKELPGTGGAVGGGRPGLASKNLSNGGGWKHWRIGSAISSHFKAASVLPLTIVGRGPRIASNIFEIPPATFNESLERLGSKTLSTSSCSPRSSIAVKGDLRSAARA
mmetsp:Transcript_45893/g.99048  ORF Transcript_45893/g.99048 Transcript_45893/m.99048 type:complete len:232 (-) Transcript_45893:861-1556(-)